MVNSEHSYVFGIVRNGCEQWAHMLGANFVRVCTRLRQYIGIWPNLWESCVREQTACVCVCVCDNVDTNCFSAFFAIHRKNAPFEVTYSTRLTDWILFQDIHWVEWRDCGLISTVLSCLFNLRSVRCLAPWPTIEYAYIHHSNNLSLSLCLTTPSPFSLSLSLSLYRSLPAPTAVHRHCDE